jgi:hypothetical protein
MKPTARPQTPTGAAGWKRHDREHRPAPPGSRHWDWPPPASVVRALGAVLGTAILAVVLLAITFSPTSLAPRALSHPIEPLLPLLNPSEVKPGLPPPGPATRVPVNTVDRFTGKPIIATSPTVNYKGYVVAFCCLRSSGYSAAGGGGGRWDRLSEAEKDTYVRGFLK